MTEKTKYLKLNHPNWETALIVTNTEHGYQYAADLCRENGDDPTQMTSEPTIMTGAEYNELPEWDG